jgi:hypothetical protein
MIKKILAYFDAKRQEERQHQIRLLQTITDQQLMMQENSLKIFEGMLKEVLDVTKSQTNVLQTWLDSFKVTEVPKTTVVREEDEVQAEYDRLRAKGFPVGADYEEQVKWIIKDLGEDTL